MNPTSNSNSIKIGKYLFAILLFLLMSYLTNIVRASNPITTGAEAPKLTATDQDGNPFDLGKAYAEGMVLVYFYPKADTPGCTAQACSLRDDIENLSQLGVQVVGISKDTPEAQKKFQEKYNLPFPLLADEDGAVASAFGVGGVLGFSNRSSFLVKDGKIVWSAPKAKTSGHAEEVAAAIKSLEQ